MGRGLCSGHYAQLHTRGEELRPLRQLHGLSSDPLYSVWKNIKTRCLNKNSPSYAHYGARGIALYSAWHDFTAFYADITGSIGARPGPSRWWQLDRIDNDGSYAPGNVRWATAADNCANKRPKVYASELDELRAENARLRAELALR